MRRELRDDTLLMELTPIGLFGYRAMSATKWYSLPDSSTHSASAWLMRQWELPEPTLPDVKQMVDGRTGGTSLSLRRA
jgi:hypothetical protein